MARKNVFVGKVDSVESLLSQFKLWSEMGSEKRAAFLEKNGDERRHSVILKNSRIHFYDTGAVYVSYSPYKSVRLWSGYDPISTYKKKDGSSQSYTLTWDCEDYYSLENKGLCKALESAF